MKTSKFTDSQIMSILKQAESGTPVATLCREHGMSNATFYKWRAKYGGMDASLIARLKELETENAKLKKCMLKRGSKPKSFRKPCQKSGKAILSSSDGTTSCCRSCRQHSFGLQGI